MTDQPIPQVNEEDIRRIVNRDFAASERELAFSILGEYGSEDWHREPVRVRVAALKLSKGETEILRREIETAKNDYRDTIALAEYPGYLKLDFSELSENKTQRIIESDWNQYQEWLSK
jgi:hypothetical protein